MKKMRRKNQMVITALALMIAVAGYLNFSGKEFSLLKQSDLDSASESAKDTLEEEGNMLTDIDAAGESVAALDDTDIDSLDVAAGDKEQLSDAGETASVDGNDPAQALETEALVANSDETAGNETASADASESALNEDSGDDSLVSASLEDEVSDTVSASSSKVVNAVTTARLTKEQSRAKNKELLMNIINSESVTKEQRKEATNKLMTLSDYMEKEASAEQVLSAKGYENAMVSMSEESVDVMVSLDEITDVDRAKIEDVVQRKTGVSINNIVISSYK